MFLNIGVGLADRSVGIAISKTKGQGGPGQVGQGQVGIVLSQV